MIVAAKDDVLKGLKRFKRLAKQDLLADPDTPDPYYWPRQAQSRLETYSELMSVVETQDVTFAYQYAVEQYAELQSLPNRCDDPSVTGRYQAFRMFFISIGACPDQPAKVHYLHQLRPIAN